MTRKWIEELVEDNKKTILDKQQQNDEIARINRDDRLCLIPNPQYPTNSNKPFDYIGNGDTVGLLDGRTVKIICVKRDEGEMTISGENDQHVSYPMSGIIHIDHQTQR